MNIEIGKRYIVSALHKKTLEEQEHYCKDMDEMIVTTLWRNGEFWIKVKDSDEQEYLQSYVGEEGVENFRVDQEPFLPHYFDEWEMDGTFDGCSEDFNGDVPDNLFEELDKAWDDGLCRSEYLEEIGFDHTDTNYFICGAVDVEETDIER